MNYPDDIGNYTDDPSSPVYAGQELDCGHLDTDDCECCKDCFMPQNECDCVECKHCHRLLGYCDCEQEIELCPTKWKTKK